MAEARRARCALLLVDVQQDFFDRPGLSPAASDLIRRLDALLEGGRGRGWPVFHARTRIASDGSDRMPHWQRRNIRACVAETPGYAPPRGLEELPGEPVLHKRFFSAFDCAELNVRLRQAKIQTLIIAGLYGHGCVHATVLDAYARGFEVLVAGDAVGSTEPVHAELSRAWLDERAAAFRPVAELLKMDEGLVGTTADRQDNTRASEPAGRQVTAACSLAAAAGRRWALSDTLHRAQLLERWANEIEQRRSDLTRLLACEIAKPIAAADDELRRTLASILGAARLARDHLGETRVAGARVRFRHVGTVALITPWNNPLAIAAGKLAPALACGNACVWKPSAMAPECAAQLLETLRAAGLPPDLVTSVTGGPGAVRQIVRDRRIDRVSVTGSNTTGQTVAALCAARQIPLQAELGGNNAALVLDDWRLDQAELNALAKTVFGFAGQRCTAVRRLVVQRGILECFSEAFAAVVRALPVGDPLDPATVAGPLISRDHREQVKARLDDALAGGARVLAQAQLPAVNDADPYSDRWLAPTLLTDIDASSDIAQQETFGPLALILPADDLEEAVALANGVPQGLLTAVYSSDSHARGRILEQIETGMLKFGRGPLAISSEAPFAGWKCSAIGPPEHGLWDRDFYARTQTLYP